MPELETQGPLTLDQGALTDYESSATENLQAGFERQWETNPVAFVGRGARGFTENWDATFNSILGEGEGLVPADAAREEIKRRGLDLKVPDGGISRWELDTLQWLKQHEISQQTTFARPHSVGATAAGFAGGFGAGAVDPINIASAFIPFVPEARYAGWLAKAGESWAARAAVRAEVGAIEGVGGALAVEPLNYFGAQSEQLDYGLQDSFVNVMFGGVLGGGLHTLAGGIYDFRVTSALDPLVTGLREAMAKAPDKVQLEALQQATRALEGDAPVQAESVLLSGLTPEQVARASGEVQRDPANIVNPIDRAASREEKVAALNRLTEENKPLVQDLIRRIDDAFGTQSGDNVKAPEKIIEKAQRPSIIARKPWHDVEHIRDSYRFKTILNDLTKIPAILKMVTDAGFKIIKADTAKLLAPEAWGWRIAVFDLQAPNGQMIEYYQPVPELEAAKKSGGHGLFERWRNRNLSELSGDDLAAYQADLQKSNDLYSEGWKTYLERTGLDESAVRASLAQADASAAATGVKSSFIDSAVPDKPGAQASPSNVAENGASSTMRLGSPESRALNASAMDDSSNANMLMQERQINDRWAEQDAKVSQFAEQEVKGGAEATVADIEAETAMYEAHLQSMRERGLVSESDMAAIAAAESEALALEHRALAYEAAGACEMEG